MTAGVMPGDDLLSGAAPTGWRRTGIGRTWRRDGSLDQHREPDAPATRRVESALGALIPCVLIDTETR